MSGLKGQFLSWWGGLSSNEHMLLRVMTALILPTLIWFIVIAPLRAWNAEAERNLASANARYARILAASQLASARPKTSDTAIQRSNAPLRTVVSQTTQERGISLSRIQPVSGGGLGLWISEIDPNLLFKWIRDLHEKHGVSVRVATIQPARDGDALQVQMQILPVGA